jgi:hypothetical protein
MLSKQQTEFVFTLTTSILCNSALATLYEEQEKPKDAIEYP